MKNRRDNNEADLVSLARQFGAVWIPQPRTAGFDGVLVWRGVHIVEIKNPERGWTLTPAELERKAQVEDAGGVYNIIETREQLLALFGITIRET